MSSKRKASEQATGAAVEVKKSRHSNSTSTLVPVSERKIAIKGVREPELLHMLCTDKTTGEKKELHFKKLVHADIDWDNKEHIDKINAWRNQIYGRAGIKNKTVTMWAKDEEAYLELYWQLLVVEANKREILMPKARIMREDFNEFFKGKVFRRTPGGEEYAPREERGSGPFTSKMTRLVKSLRPYVEGKTQGKRGSSFYPKINQEMLSEYRKLKDDLIAFGCNDPKVIPWEEVEDAQNTKEYVLRCREYIANLPDQEDVEMGQPEDEDTTLVVSEEQEAIDKELLELATDPNDIEADAMDTTSAHENSPSEKSAPALRELSATVLNTITPRNKKASATPKKASVEVKKERVTPVKKREASVAQAVADENMGNDSELTLVEENVVVEKGKDVAQLDDTIAQQEPVAPADQEAAEALLAFHGS